MQAAALSQALLDGGYIESFSEPIVFTDGYVRYRKGNLFSTNFTRLSANYEVPTQEEPNWVQQIPHEPGNTGTTSFACKYIVLWFSLNYYRIWHIWQVGKV